MDKTEMLMKLKEFKTYVDEEACSYFRMGLERQHKSVILDWRQRPAGHLSEVGGPLVTQANLSAPPPVCVLWPLQKICVNSLWLYSYFTQTSPSKNKNINHIFIYLRVLRCLSSGPIYDTKLKSNEHMLLIRN